MAQTEMEELGGASQKDGVNLQCVNSSEFVVGKQTTFNGPVTIINYAERPGGELPLKLSKEEIVIRESILNPASVSEIKAFSEGKVTEKDDDRARNRVLKAITTKYLRVPAGVWLLAAVVAVLAPMSIYLGASRRSEPSEEPDRTIIRYNGTEYSIYGRKSWNARPPLSRVQLKTPVHYVVISHTASAFCYDKQTCATLMRNIQGYQMSLTPPLADISYSFSVGGDGNIYEGRGWTTRTALTGFLNNRNLDFNFLGSFEGYEAPTYGQLEAVKALIEYGVNSSYIDANYTLVAANATFNTLSPGIQVYNEIKTWPHFDPDPKMSLSKKSHGTVVNVSRMS